MKKEFWLIIVLAVIIVVLAGVLLWPKPPAENPPAEERGIYVDFPKMNEEILSPLKITGYVNGNGWVGFEGQVGTVILTDSEGKELALGILTAVTNWMSLPVSFETYLQFSSDKDQSGKLIFRNENPSGEPERDKEFVLPVKIKKGSGELVKVKAYFNNSKMDPEVSCNKVFPVERQVPKTQALARAALEELLKGPINLEEDAGFATSINSGVKIQKLTIESGVAKVDFDDQLEFQVGGSCKVSAIRAQITETLKQFSTVKDVVISINGRTEDILQP